MDKKITEYRHVLRSLSDWLPYLLANSRLPSPQSNLPLAHAAALEATYQQVESFLQFDRNHPDQNTSESFVVFCGVIGLGKFAGEDQQAKSSLKKFANDDRWRIRESVAMGLQHWGELNIQQVLTEVRLWVDGTPLEMRATAAGLCEPVLLKDKSVADTTLDILDRITNNFVSIPNLTAEDSRTLRQGLAYCWSVAVVESPEKGKVLMEKWIRNNDPDIRWIMKENLKKNRLSKMDGKWVEDMQKTV
jgi:hypothetical protein